MKITNLTINAMTAPLGIDTPKPLFAWKMDTGRTGARQNAYRIVVYPESSLTAPVWDSGIVSDYHMNGIPYDGTPLLPRTRYYWQVSLCDEINVWTTSDFSWFETGLMGTDASVWHQAQWIGSPFPSTNTAAMSVYQYSLDYQVEPGNTAGIVFAARNKDNYLLLEVDMDNRRLRFSETCDNAWGGSFQDGNIPTTITLGAVDGYPIDTDAVPGARRYKWNRIVLTVTGKELTVAINNKTIIDHEALMPVADMFEPRRSCLSSIGFRQIGSRACYDNLMIADPISGTVYRKATFPENAGSLSILGTIESTWLAVEDRFELACPIPAVNLLGSFYIEEPVVRARLYTTARGFYQVQINGEKTDASFFAPGFTDYRLRIPYQTADVTNLIRSGVNRIYAVVAKGYYSGYLGYCGPMIYGDTNSFLGLLILTLENGTEKIFVTGEDWRYTDCGPITDSDYLDGESYDARLELEGWNLNDYNDLRWQPCGILPWPKAPVPTNGTFSSEIPFVLTAQNGPAAVIERVLRPIAITENPMGHYVYDFGQNMVGTIRLHVKGPRGLSLKVRYGEMNYSNGEIYIRNLRSAANTDCYTLKGDPNGEIFTPTFTSHGFRYVEVTGNGSILFDNDCITDIEGLVLCNTPDVIGDFTCSDPLVNKLQSNIQWGQRGNSLLVFTDCPQRNERMGWTGDAQVFAATAAFNMDIQAFMRKWLEDVRDGQLMYNKQGAVPDTAPLGGDNRPAGCAGWADACVIVPWKLYLACGDVSILRENYECMEKWIAYQSLDSRQNHGLRTVNGVPVPEQSDLSSKPLIQVQQSRGDHLTFDPSTPFILTATAYAAHVADLMSRIAAILDKPEDSAFYRSRFEQIREAFREAWVMPDGSLAYWGEMSKSEPAVMSSAYRGSKNIPVLPINQTRYSNEPGNPYHPSQTAYTLAIDFDLMPEETMKHSVECFLESIKDRDDHLSVGFLGIGHLLLALSRLGENETAFRLLEQKGNPGWLYSVVNGATTIWERWNSYIAETGTFGEVSMNSFNHYAYGAIGQWMYETVLGIRSGEHADEAGYHRILLTPNWGGSLTHASGFHLSPYGRIESGWELSANKVTYRCVIPPNTTAHLTLPLTRSSSIRPGTVSVRGTGNAVPIAASAFGFADYELIPGKYEFTIG